MQLKHFHSFGIVIDVEKSHTYSHKL